MKSSFSKPVVALFRNVFLPYSETFIYDSIQSYSSFQPVVFTKKHVNEHLFPVDFVYSPNSLSRHDKIDRLLFSTGIPSPAILQKFAELKPEIIHAHFGQSGVVAMPYAKRLELPLIVSLHGNDLGILLGRQKFLPKWWWYALSFSKLIRQTALFLTASVDLSERLQELGCPPTKIRLHRLGIDLERFQPDQKKSPDATVFMIGRLVEKKGFTYGIQAFAATLEQITYNRSATLCIIGDGPLDRDLRVLVEKLELSERVKFLGRQPHEKIVEHLQQRATVVVCPSIVSSKQDRDSGLIVAKEAAACGVPVIGTRHGGLPEIIEDGVTGYLVPEKNVEALAASLRTILSNGNLQEEMGRAARRKMEREYDIKQRMQELESIYSELIQQRKH